MPCGPNKMARRAKSEFNIYAVTFSNLNLHVSPREYLSCFFLTVLIFGLFFLHLLQVAPRCGSSTPAVQWDPRAPPPASASTFTNTPTSKLRWAPRGPSKASRCGGSRRAAPTGRRWQCAGQRWWHGSLPKSQPWNLN